MNIIERFGLGIGTCVLSAVLAACGGGDTEATAEGAYQGTTNLGFAFEAVILDDGSFWALYGINSGSAIQVAGFVSGAGSSSGGNAFTAPSVQDYGQVPAVNGSLTAQFVAGQSIRGSIVASEGTETFDATVIPASQFNYASPARIADIQGAWSLNGTDGSAVALTIDAQGNVSGNSQGCAFAGTAMPRAFGRNIFNVSLTYGAAPCLLAGQTATGIGIHSSVSGTAQHQLIVAVVDPTHTRGQAYSGLR